ncbi:luc7-like protein 3 isoform X2 [Diachasma alloeum]|uniref:luc7-like protein 3 isoform X2 n=1 Tax=Diachasma alloeum TaxID=454923 RepID=UPI00073813A9|nr:luc7-like protein 3 isoform X2 [Diachasma alloeum]
MTTMDSDSESQDSDEGRRFRFEATRKDPMTPFQSYRRDISPLNNASRHCRTRSRDRTIHTRRENRNIPISTKERTNERNNYEEPRSSKEKKNLSSDSGRKKEAGSKNRDLKKTYKTSRDVQERNSSCRDDQILQSRDEKRKRSRDRNWEYKSSGKYRKYSREREQLSQRAKSFQRQKPSGEKIGNHDKDKLNQLEHRNIEDKPDRQDCKDLNLSDFDIVSDAEGNSDNSDEIIESGNENIERRDCNAAENDKISY